MVTEEQLAALDLTLWLGSTERAAEVDFSNQSTISRRHHKVLRQFGIELKRTKRELEVSGDLQLLDLERQVHQMARSNAGEVFASRLPSGFRTVPALFQPRAGQ